MESDEVLKRILDQNDKLIEALTKTSPVEVIRALNPIPSTNPPSYTLDTFSTDPSRLTPEDPWGDPRIPDTALIPAGPHWTTPTTEEHDETPEAEREP